MKRKIFLILFFCINSLFIKAQDNIDEALVAVADEMYGYGSKKDALEQYLAAIEINPDNLRANYMAGRVYLETVQKELSVPYLIKAYQLNPNIAPDILFLIANGYQLGAKFDDAIVYYKKYKESLTEAKAAALKSTIKNEVIKTERKIFECQNGKIYYQNKVNYEINNISDVVNSEFPDYAPAVNADNNFMIFTSRREGGVGRNKDVDNEYFEDIWYTTKDENGQWTKPKNFGKPINSETHDASIGLSPDGREMFLYKPDNGGDIYVSKLTQSGTWGPPTSMSKVVNSRYNEPSVSISSDNRVLYFSSDRPGGFGGLDIYKAELDEKGNWSKPQNLGSTINTEYDDDSPFIDYDGKTLYFSSRGHKGMGGYDVYKAEYDSTRKAWKQPINMGYPVNSPDDDIYFVITKDGKTGYYASAKGDGYGDKDIYMINLEKAVITNIDEPQKDEPKPIAKVEEPKKDEPTTTTKVEEPKKDEPKPVAKIEEPNKTIEQPKTEPKTETSKPTAKEPNPIVVNKEEKKPEPVEKTINTPKPNPEPIKTPEPKPIPAALALKPSKIKGVVYDYETNETLSARIVVNDQQGNLMKVIDVADDGKYEFELSQSKPSKISLTVTKDGYIYNNILIPVPADSKTQKTVVREFYLKKINLGSVFILRNIYYDFDKAVIKKESFPYLNQLVAWLKAHPNVNLEISGHTDNVGLPRYNKVLSQKRVDAVMLYLTSKGIAPERLTAIGYGSERPLASNDDEKEGREINRRTEFKITKR
jgi:outer membrane protein OmpA-like peptidoglycan-associated protein